MKSLWMIVTLLLLFSPQILAPEVQFADKETVTESDNEPTGYIVDWDKPPIMPKDEKKYGWMLISSCKDGCKETERCNEDLGICYETPTGCVPVHTKKNSDEQIDIVFVGDGYSLHPLIAEVKNLLDHAYIKIENDDYIGDGFFTIEPFKSNRDLFNFWVVENEELIPRKNYRTRAGDTVRKIDYTKAAELASKCSFAEYIVVVSKEKFRSYAYRNSNDCYISIPNARDPNDTGKVFLHEFGHTFGSLADEYIETIKGDKWREPNCAPDEETAKTWWKDIEGAEFHKGCAFVGKNIRSTQNSLMRHSSPDGVVYGPVNEKALLKKINEFKEAAEKAKESSIGKPEVAELSYLLYLESDGKSLSYKRGKLIEGSAPLRISEFEDGFTLNAESLEGETLETLKFNISRYLLESPPQDIFDEKSKQIKEPVSIIGELETNEIAIVVPFFKEAEKFEIFNEADEKVLTIDIVSMVPDDSLTSGECDSIIECLGKTAFVFSSDALNS